MAMLVITRCVPWVAPSDSETAMNPSLYRCPAQDPCCPRGFPAALSGSICKKQAPFFAHELILMTKEFHYFNFFNNLLAASSGCFFWLLLLNPFWTYSLRLCRQSTGENLATYFDHGRRPLSVAEPRDLGVAILDQWINQRKRMRSKTFQNHPKPYHFMLWFIASVVNSVPFIPCPFHHLGFQPLVYGRFMSAGCPGRRKTAAPKVVEEAPRSPKRLQRGAQFTVFVYWDLRRYHEDLVGGSEHLDYFSTYIYIYILILGIMVPSDFHIFSEG